MKSHYDVIIVGARCAGATLATYLARAGLSVLAVDKDKLPSDQILSTHVLHPPGTDVLDELGVGDAMRKGGPATKVIRLSKNGSYVDVSYQNNRVEYCPRRKRLDALLQDAAREAGADLFDRSRVAGLVEEKGRVTGARIKHDGKEHAVTARLTVGADGRHSTMAKLVGAEEYYGYDSPRAIYWSYWEIPDLWHTDAYPFGMFIGNNRGFIRSVFQTDRNCLLVATNPPAGETQAWRADPLASLKAAIGQDPVTGPLIDGSDPVEPVRGTIKERYFFRRAAGPGWVLIGDAGHHKDFIIGDGITEALLQARSLSAAIQKDDDRELVRWWRQRDVEALPLFFHAQDEGSLGPPHELVSVVYSNAARSPELRNRMPLVPEHALSPYDVFPVSTVMRWTLTSALRGRPGVIRDFLQMGKRSAMVQKEIDKRTKLLMQLTDK